MDEENAVIIELDRLRAEGAADALFADRDWPFDHWEAALAQAAPLAMVRTLALPAEPWTAAMLARFAAVFPAVESLSIDWIRRADERRPTLCEALVPWANARLTSVHCRLAHEWGELDVSPALLRFKESLAVLRLPHLRHNEIVKVLAGLGALPSLVELECGLVHEPGAVLSQLAGLRSFACVLDPKHTIEAVFVSESLRSLSVSMHARAASVPRRFVGALPSLRSLRFKQSLKGATAVDRGSLCALAATARGSLSEVNIEAPDGWTLARSIAEGLDAERAATKMTVARVTRAESDDAAREREADFACAMALRALGVTIDSECCLALADRTAHLRGLREELARLEWVSLIGDVHSALFERPEDFAFFAGARRMHVFDAYACTTAALDALLTALPALEFLTLINNRNPAMTELRVRSASLETLTLTHFHRLDRWDFDAPKLSLLTLDNCDPADCSELGDEYGLGDDTVYGNFGERVAASILDGDAKCNLPSLRELSVWNNSIGFGKLIAVESMRVDIACRVGHPVLEQLRFANVPHLRSLRLASVPKLQRVAISQFDDEGVGTTWFERAELTGIPEGCQVELCSITTGRVGLGA